ncbi:hypothetical protein ABGB14_22910 [Nonomuraea sp. B10E15]
MKSYLRKALAGCAAALAVMVAFPTPAFAINHADCNVSYSREFLQIFNLDDSRVWVASPSVTAG